MAQSQKILLEIALLEPYEVDAKTNEITAIPAFIKQMALQGVVFAFDAISTQKKPRK